MVEAGSDLRNWKEVAFHIQNLSFIGSMNEIVFLNVMTLNG